MSRCKACDAIMKKIDWQPLEPGDPEEDVCISCRQEIFKCEDECICLGFTTEEVSDMMEGFYRDYKQGKIDDDRDL